jgi:hypothetical protein
MNQLSFEEAWSAQLTLIEGGKEGRARWED